MNESSRQASVIIRAGFVAWFEVVALVWDQGSLDSGSIPCSGTEQYDIGRFIDSQRGRFESLCCHGTAIL